MKPTLLNRLPSTHSKSSKDVKSEHSEIDWLNNCPPNFELWEIHGEASLIKNVIINKQTELRLK